MEELPNKGSNSPLLVFQSINSPLYVPPASSPGSVGWNAKHMTKLVISIVRSGSLALSCGRFVFHKHTGADTSHQPSVSKRPREHAKVLPVQFQATLVTCKSRSVSLPSCKATSHVSPASSHMGSYDSKAVMEFHASPSSRSISGAAARRKSRMAASSTCGRSSPTSSAGVIVCTSWVSTLKDCRRRFTKVTFSVAISIPLA
mmetsp:Transcript_103947/g.291151  ORF Transcript_103947/g.291151 Transcript_103947/m.291151 type:complete len:202 (+) Transcript_103947:1058-1663(+)